jgi:hypothetical protein
MAPVLPKKDRVRAAAEAVRLQIRRTIASLTPATAAKGIDKRIDVLVSRQMDWDAAVQAYLWHAHRLAPAGANNQRLQQLFEELLPKGGRSGPLWLNHENSNARSLIRSLNSP